MTLIIYATVWLFIETFTTAFNFYHYLARSTGFKHRKNTI